MKMNGLLRDLDLPTPHRRTRETLPDAMFAVLSFAVLVAFAALLFWGSPV